MNQWDAERSIRSFCSTSGVVKQTIETESILVSIEVELLFELGWAIHAK